MGSDRSLLRELARRGVTRRTFLDFCGSVAAVLALPKSAAATIAKAVVAKGKPTVVWLEFQDCTGCTESFLRASHPTTAELVLDVLSVDYHETIMAAAGAQAEQARDAAVAQGGYIAVVEGSIPTGEHGAYCVIGGRSAIDIARQVIAGAAATIAVGTCAAYGGLPAASPNPTGALGVGEAIPGVRNLVNLPGCPVNAENITALLAHYFTFGRWPARDDHGRPLFAYGKCIHENCERRAHYDAGQFAEAFGDAGHRAGYCLYKLGCKGPATFHNCPNIGWNGGTSWPVACGHPCMGCSEPRFWDEMTPFYRRIPDLGAGISIDRAGVIATGLVGAGLVAHGMVRATATIVDRYKKSHPAAAAKDEKGGAP